MAKRLLPEKHPGFIYFIRAGRTLTVKIGYGRNPYSRVDDMQVGSPHPLYLIGYFPGDRNEEFAWHKRWSHLHIRGEWFQLKNELRFSINDALCEPGAQQYLRISTDWKEVNKRTANHFKQAKRPPFVERPNSGGGTKSGTSAAVSNGK